MSIAIRKQIIELVKRRVKPGIGSLHQKWREKQMTKHLLQNWQILSKELDSIHYAVAGGLAVGVYSPERATQDIDLVIVSMQSIEERFKKLGYKCLGKLSIGGMSWEMPDGREIDVIDISDQPWADIALNEAQTASFFEFPVLPVQYLILMKLAASRMQDIADIGRIVKHADELTRLQIRAAVKKFRPQDLEDLEQIILIEDNIT